MPGAVKKVSKIKAIFTTDFLQTASGMVWSNSENASAGGCLVDGRMSPQEQALADGAYSWSLLVGPQGGWANILQMHTAFVWRNMKLFYLDDSSYRYEKDPDINGTWGSTGYHMDKVDKVEDKVTFRTNIFAIPNSFTSPETRQLLQIVEHPLETVVRRTWGAEVNGDDPPPEEER